MTRIALSAFLLGIWAVASAQSGTVTLHEVTGLAHASEHACTSSAGRLYCWGMNSRGQLGDGSVNGRTVAASVVGLDSPGQFSVGGFKGISSTTTTRYAHTCALHALQPTLVR